jgi:hypothetical protein
MENSHLLIREKDAYVNITHLSRLCGKRWHNYYKNKKTMLFLQQLSVDVEMPINALIEITMTGPNDNRATWVHPSVATYIASLISVEFAVKVSRWIEEAKVAIPRIQQEYTDELHNLKPCTIDAIESRIRDRIAEELGGRVEVSCRHGRIDVVTDDEVIEVKHIVKYLHALGQVLGYGSDFPHLKKRVILFGTATEVNHYLHNCKYLFMVYDVSVCFEVIDEAKE